jgi:hypothetical protein
MSRIATLAILSLLIQWRTWPLLDEVRSEHTAEIDLQSFVADEADLVPWDQVYLDILDQAPFKIYYR